MAGVARSSDRAALALLCAAHGTLVLDATVANVALPSIAADLDVSAGAVHWVMSAYALAFGGALLVGGRAADRVGHRAALAAGLVLFSLASLACTVAPTIEILVTARVLQGLGAALAAPAALSLLAVVFPEGHARHRALAAWASTSALAAAVGLAAGGAITQLLSWRAIFVVGLPIALAVPVLAIALLPRGRRDDRPSFDPRSGLLGSAAVVAFAAALTAAGGAGPLAAQTGVLATVTCVTVAAFLRRERRTTRPLVPRVLWNSPGLVPTLVTGAVGGALVLGSFMLLPFALHHELGLTPVATGVLLVASRAPSLVWTRLVRRLLDTIGPATTAGVGMGLFALAELSFTLLGSGGIVAATIGALALGIAIPCVFMSVSTVVLGSARHDERGAASGLLATAQWLGGACGLALVTLAIEPAAGHALATGTGFWVCVALSAVGAVAALAARRPRSAPEAAPAPA